MGGGRYVGLAVVIGLGVVTKVGGGVGLGVGYKVELTMLVPLLVLSTGGR